MMNLGRGPLESLRYPTHEDRLLTLAKRFENRPLKTIIFLWIFDENRNSAGRHAAICYGHCVGRTTGAFKYHHAHSTLNGRERAPSVRAIV